MVVKMIRILCMFSLFLVCIANAVASDNKVFFAKKKLQLATVAFEKQMDKCFSNANKVSSTELQNDGISLEMTKTAIDYMHYSALSTCMKVQYENYLKAGYFYKTVTSSKDIGDIDSFVSNTWVSELDAEYKFKQLPKSVQQHFEKLAVLQTPFDAMSLILELDNPSL
ncbi:MULTISPECIES: hypothetical protein [unclassified Pseudoalteromonas]|uniref:hypothetical protein n=2 Tax=unclassified Pseudoalteromonas TaxID=194690 RepID=UPI0004636294